MKLETMIFETDGKIGRLTLNRPQLLNAMPLQGALELNSVAETIRDTDDVRVVLIRGAGHAGITGPPGEHGGLPGRARAAFPLGTAK